MAELSTPENRCGFLGNKIQQGGEKRYSTADSYGSMKFPFTTYLDLFVYSCMHIRSDHKNRNCLKIMA